MCSPDVCCCFILALSKFGFNIIELTHGILRDYFYEEAQMKHTFNLQTYENNP